MEIKYNDTFSTSHSSDDVFDFIEKDTTLLNGPRNEATLFPKPTEVSLNETLYSGYKPQNIQLDEPENSLIKGSSIEIKPILLSDPDVNAQAAFAKSHTRDFYKGRSFRYAGKGEEGVHYINDEYITDFVVKDGVFLVCKKSNMSSGSNEPTEGVYEGDQIIAVISDYWEVVLAGGLRGKTYIPEYDNNSDSLIGRLVNPEHLPQEFQTYLGIKSYVDYSLVPIQEEIIDVKSETDITKRNVNAIEGEIINLGNDISTLEIITGHISTQVEDLEGNFSDFVQTAEGFFFKVGDLENNVGQLGLTSQQFGVQLENAEGDISRLTIQADQISTRVENAEGDISQINQRADEISTQVENQQGDISRISQKADQIQSEVENQQGDISRITQRADIIESQVQNLDGDVSTISQRADQIQSQVENINGDISRITQTADQIQSEVENIEGDISTITQRANLIESQVQNQAGDISRISQTADQIQTEVENLNGDISTITQRADLIESSVSNLEGDVSTLSQTADEISARVTNTEGDISAITQRADLIESQVQNQAGDISRISQTADQIQSEVINIEGDISAINQRADSIELEVLNQQGDISDIRQTADEINLRVENVEGDVATLDVRADQITSIVNDQQGQISQIRQTSTEIESEVAANKTDADNKYIETNSRITQTAAAINLEVSRVEDKADASKSNIEILANSIAGTVSSYAYDSSGHLTTETQNLIKQTNQDTVLTISGTELSTVGISIHNASQSDNHITLFADKVSIKAASADAHNATALGIYWDSTSQSYKISAANLQVEGAFSTTAGTDATTGQRKLVLDDAATAATGPTGYLTEALYGSGGSAASPTGGVYGTITPMTVALSNFTTITGGLVLTTELILGQQQSGQGWLPGAGMSGVYDARSHDQGGATGHGIAAGYGGDRVDKADLTTTQIEEGGANHRGARTLFRMDGSGYLADRAIYGSDQGDLHINENVTLGPDSNNTVQSILNFIASIGSWFVQDTITIGGVDKTVLRVNMGTQGNTGFAGVVGDGFLITNGDQMVLGGTPGSGGSGGASYLYALGDVDDALISPSANAILQYNSSTHSWEGHTPATQIGMGVSELTTGELIRLVLGDNFNSNGTVKEFINSSVATATATYRGNYNEKTDLNLNPSATRAQIATKLGTVVSNADDNDYCFVEIPTSASTPAQIERTERYKYSGSSWSYEYTLNNSGFTAVQGDAINSGITSGKITTYDTLYGYFANGTTLGVANGGTGKSSGTKYGVVYASGTGTLAQVSNNTEAKKKFLRMTGTGSAGNTPAWDTVAYGDLPAMYIGNAAVQSSAQTEQNIGGLGHLTIANGCSIRWLTKPAAGAEAQIVSALGFSANNNLNIGHGTTAHGNTYINGKVLYLRYGTSRTNGIKIGGEENEVVGITAYLDVIPSANNSKNLGSESAMWKYGYIKRVYLASDVYIEYNSSNDYVYINKPLVTNGDQIVTGGTPGGGSSGGVQYLYALQDVDDNLITPTNGYLLQYNGTKGTGVNPSTVGVTDAGTVNELNDPNPLTALRVGSPSVLSSGLAGKNYLTSAVTNVAVGGSGHTEELAITKGGTTSYLTVPYATNVVRFKRYEGTLNVEGGYDLNTLLAGGGITSQYNSSSRWANGPSNMSFGGVVQINTQASNSLAMQLAWDVVHNATTQTYKTGKLWWRDATYHNSAAEWGAWHILYDNTTLLLNGAEGGGSTLTFYAPTTAGTSGQLLKSSGSNAAPAWTSSALGASNKPVYLNSSGVLTEGSACVTLAGAQTITGAKTHSANITLNNGVGLYCKDTNDNSVEAVYMSSSDYLRIGYGNRTSGITAIYGKTFRIGTNDTASGPDIYIGGLSTTHNTDAANIYFHSLITPTGIRNGVKVSAEHVASADRLNLSVYTSNNSTSPYAPSWNKTLEVTYNGKVNVGAPSFSDGALNVNGAIVSAGDQIIASDERIKRNFKAIELSVEQIASCRAVSFDWAAGGHSFGSVAQDWEPLVPEAVKQGDIKTLAYGQLALVAAINIAKHDTERDKEIRVLKDSLEKANGKIAALEEEIKQLKIN